MNFHILTLFPEMVMNGLNTSIIGRAVNAGHLSIEAVNIRDYAFNKHQSVDDYPYGGGAGMLMQAEPVYLAHKAVAEMIQTRMRGSAQCEKPVLKPEKPKSLRPNPIPIFISPSYLQHPGVQSRNTLQRLMPLQNPDGF